MGVVGVTGEVKVIVRKDRKGWGNIELIRDNRYFSISVSNDPLSVAVTDSYFVGRILINESHYRELMEALNEKDVSRLVLKLIAILNEIREEKERDKQRLLEDLGNRFIDQALKMVAEPRLSERERGYILLRVTGAIKEKVR